MLVLDISNTNIHIQLTHTPQIVGSIYPIQKCIFINVHFQTVCPKRTQNPSDLGEPSNRIFGKNWEFGSTEGGGSADPKFLSNFSRTNFTMLNGQKCDETHST